MVDPQLVRNDDADVWGLYHPDRDVIEAAVGDVTHEIPGESLGVNWYQTEEVALRASIGADIQAVRADIENLIGGELTDEQRQELERLELKLESHEKVLEIAQEVDADC